jgi:hypothetical protein
MIEIMQCNFVVAKVLQGEGSGILPGHKKTKVVVQMLKDDAESARSVFFLDGRILLSVCD